MRKLYLQYTYLLVILIFMTIQTRPKYFTSPLNLYISDRNSSKILKNVVQNKQIMSVLFTNKHCEECYHDQSQLTSLISKLYQSFKIKTFRCQLSLNSNLQQQFNIKRFPMIHFIYGQQDSYKIYLNNNLVILQQVIKIIKKLQFYLKGQNQNINQGILLNINKIFIDKQTIIQYFGLNDIYSNLPLINFKNNVQFQKLLNQYQINEDQRSSCTLFYKNTRKCYNPTTFQQIQYLFTLSNFQIIQQFTQKSYKAYQELHQNRYIFVAVLDSIFLRQKSQQYMIMLNRILQRRQFRNKIYIFWMETQINKQKLVHLGFKESDHAPLFALLDLNKSNKHILVNEKGYLFTQQSILSFIKGIIHYDQQKETEFWNKQLLIQTLERLSPSKQILHVDELSQISKQKDHFALIMPYAQQELLQDNKLFHKPIINYNYLIERVNKFLELQIKINYISFLKNNKEKKTNGFGLFFCKHRKYERISQKIIFEIQDISQKIESIFELPELFWVDEINYEQYITQNQYISDNPFTYVEIIV